MTMDRTPPKRTLRTTLVGTLLCAGLATQAAAQGAVQGGAARVEGLGMFRAGLVRLDLEELNARLRGSGWPELDSTVPVWGGGGYGRVGDFLLGMEIHGGLDAAAGPASRRIRLNGGYGLARSGYVTPSLGGLTLYPSVGVGAGGMWLHVAEPGAPDFDDVLEDPGRSSTLSTGIHPLFDAGVGLEYRVAVVGREDGTTGGVLVGVEAGYLFAPGSTAWELDGSTGVGGGPELGIGGFYVWLAIGGWGRRGGQR